MLLVALAAAAPSVTLVAVGDVLPHRRVKASAQPDWKPVLGAITARIQQADIAFANLESPIAPDANLPVHDEVFNAPASLAPGLAEAGFDVLSMANNHVWDQGVPGLLETRRRVLAAGMKPVGAGATCAEAAAPVITEVDGLKIAWVAVVDLLNLDLRSKPDAPCVHVAGPPCTTGCEPDRDALFFRADTKALSAWIAGVRTQADLVVVSAHWGDEYRRAPLPEYEALAAAFVGAGADVVLGHHPHVLQPVRWVESNGRRGLVAFSLGNFVSDMGRTFDPGKSPERRGDTRDGVLLWITVHREVPLRLEAHLEPVWTDNGDTIQVLPLDRVPEPLQSQRRARILGIVGPDVPLR